MRRGAGRGRKRWAQARHRAASAGCGRGRCCRMGRPECRACVGRRRVRGACWGARTDGARASRCGTNRGRGSGGGGPGARRGDRRRGAPTGRSSGVTGRLRGNTRDGCRGAAATSRGCWEPAVVRGGHCRCDSGDDGQRRPWRGRACPGHGGGLSGEQFREKRLWKRGQRQRRPRNGSIGGIRRCTAATGAAGFERIQRSDTDRLRPGTDVGFGADHHPDDDACARRGA